MHRRTLPLLAAAAVALAACTDGTPTGSGPDAAPQAPPPSALHVPLRGAERPGTLISRDDRELWLHLSASGGRAVVGLKAPDENRGVYRGRLLVTPEEWAAADRIVSSIDGVRVLSRDEVLPTMEVEVRTMTALRALRKRAEVDYVEPVLVEDDLHSFAGVGGCGWGSGWTGDRQYTASGDVYSQKFTAMGIPQAWALSSGAGVTIGLTDTGLSSTQGQFGAGFTAGESGGRTLRLVKVGSFANAYDECGHGTRMAGIIAAPRDGQNVGGIAYRANLVSVRQANGVAAVSSSDAKASVRAAVQNGAQIVVMAWESLNWWWQVSDEIEYWHYNRPVLFFGAAGTSGCGDLIWDDNVVFPADMGVVVAVTGITYPGGGVPCGIHYGPEVDLTAYLDVPSTGRYTGDVVGMGGSSNATAVAGSVAALVWSRNPWMTRDQVRARLEQTASRYPTRHSREGYGLINAYRAVSGS